MRTCNSCGEDKPLDAYGKNKAMPDGLLKVCKSCMNAKQRKRSKTARGRATARRAGKRYRERHPEKISAKAKRQREREPERLRRTARESAARRYAADPSRVKAQARSWRERNGDRRTAQRRLASAVEKGEVVRPEACERCGSEPGRGRDGRRLIQGHHADYEKPLEVEWVCPPCHKAADAERVALDKAQVRSVSSAP